MCLCVWKGSGERESERARRGGERERETFPSIYHVHTFEIYNYSKTER